MSIIQSSHIVSPDTVSELLAAANAKLTVQSIQPVKHKEAFIVKESQETPLTCQ